MEPQSCATCYGQGEVVTEQGPSVCPDCMGDGKLLGRLERTEWRLRDIESAHRGDQHGCEPDVRWLVAELRRSREALLRILARSLDADTDDALAADVKYEANQALGLYKEDQK
jgi:hypothetical protein